MLLQDYRDLRGTLRQAGLDRDDRGGRLAVLRRVLPPLRRAARAGGLMLLQAIMIDDGLYEIEKASRSFANTHIFPGGCLPSKRLIADCVGRVTEHAPGLDRRHHRPLPAHARRLARALQRRLGAPAPARLRRALPPALELLPGSSEARLPRAADRRRADALRQAGRGDDCELARRAASPAARARRLRRGLGPGDRPAGGASAT